nr:EOG090X0D3U [Daphnia pulex]
MSIKIEAETELQLVCNNVDQSLVMKETPECEVSKSDGNDETSVELGNDSSCNLAVNSLSNKKDNTEEIVITLKEESQSEKKDLPVIPVLSKSAMKKLKRKALWAQQKKERRIREKEKRKKRRLDPTRSLNTVTRKQLKSATMANSSCKVAIVVDLSFDTFMDEKSIAKCVKQICRCYSINRRAANPVQYHITSLDGASLTEMSKNSGYQNWDVNLHGKHFTDLFSKEKIVYLTAESDHLIDKIEDDHVYIIGGLVDHNSHKGLCHRLAVEKGLRHGRLPIGENIDMKTRKVLTIDHVFNIMVNVCNGQKWKEALLEVLPARKGAQEKDTDGNFEDEEDCDAEEDFDENENSIADEMDSCETDPIST